MTNEINRDLYEKYGAKYKTEKAKILEEMGNVEFNLSNLKKTAEKHCRLLANLPSLWASGGYSIKRELQNLMFPDGILFDRLKNNYRTTRVLTPILQLSGLARALGDQKEKPASFFADGFPLVAGDGLARSASLHSLIRGRALSTGTLGAKGAKGIFCFVHSPASKACGSFTKQKNPPAKLVGSCW